MFLKVGLESLAEAASLSAVFVGLCLREIDAMLGEVGDVAMGDVLSTHIYLQIRAGVGGMSVAAEGSGTCIKRA